MANNYNKLLLYAGEIYLSSQVSMSNEWKGDKKMDANVLALKRALLIASECSKLKILLGH